MASGFTLAVAICDSPSLRDELILRAVSDAKKFGLSVQSVDISKVYKRDFVAAVRSQLDLGEGNSRMAVLVKGIDPLVYRPDADRAEETEGRPPFVARLNFDRERISHGLPYPIILWLEKEAFTLLLREAPDLTQWVSARFDFGGVSSSGLEFFETMLWANRMKASETSHASLSNEDALLRELKNIPNNGNKTRLNERIVTLLLAAQRCLLSSQKSKAEKLVREVLQLQKLLHGKELESGGHLLLGSMQMSSGRLKQAIHELKLALRCANRDHDTYIASLALLQLGRAHARTKSYPLARGYLEKSGKAAASSGDKGTMLEALTKLGDVYSSSGASAKALDAFEQALRVAKEIGALREEAEITFDIGDLLVEAEPAKAIGYFEICLPIATRLGERDLEADCLCGIGQGHVELDEPRRAISYLAKALTIVRQLGDPFFETSVLGMIASIYLEIGDMETARCHIDRALLTARAAREVSMGAELLLMLSEACEAAGETEKATESAREALKIFRHAKKLSGAKTAKKVLSRLQGRDARRAAAIAHARPGEPSARDSGR